MYLLKTRGIKIIICLTMILSLIHIFTYESKFELIAWITSVFFQVTSLMLLRFIDKIQNRKTNRYVGGN
jgi:hypothetical protein